MSQREIDRLRAIIKDARDYQRETIIRSEIELLAGFKDCSVEKQQFTEHWDAETEKILFGETNPKRTKKMTILHLKGLEPIGIDHEWGGCNIIDHDGRLWRVEEAVFRLDGVDVYAHLISDFDSVLCRDRWKIWNKKETT